MTNALVLSNTLPSESKLSATRLSGIERRSRELLATGLAHGFRKTYYVAASMYNLKSTEAYKANVETGTWVKFCAAHGLDVRDMNRYALIGAKMADVLIEQGVDISDGIQQQHIEGELKPRLDALRGLSFRNLYDLVTRVDVFDKSFTYEEIQKMLPAPEKSESALAAERVQRGDLSEYHQHMKEIAESHGWKWNRKAQRVEHEDGTPLADNELAQITHPKEAMYVWHNVESSVHHALASMMQAMKNSAPTYIRYARAIPNEKVRNEVGDVRARILRQLEEMKHMVLGLECCNLDRILEIKKHGLGEYESDQESGTIPSNA